MSNEEKTKMVKNRRTKKNGKWTWENFSKRSVEDHREFKGWDFMLQLLISAMKTPYYSKGSYDGMFSDDTLKRMRQELRQRDRDLLVTMFLTGGRVSEVIMLHSGNFELMDDRIRVRNMPLLKRYKKIKDKVSVIQQVEKPGPGYQFMKWIDTMAWVKRTWITETLVKERQVFPIPMWEPFTNYLVNLVKKSKRGEGGYHWLFPSSHVRGRKELSGVEMWMADQFGLVKRDEKTKKVIEPYTRPWISETRAYQIVKMVSKPLVQEGKLTNLSTPAWNHLIRGQRASQCASQYGFFTPHLSRFFGWEGGWTSGRATTAQIYAGLSDEDLWEQMSKYRGRVESSKEKLEEILRREYSAN